MKSIYHVESHPDYLAWLAEVRKTKPHAGRTLFLAKEIDGALHFGVRLLDDGEIFVPAGEGAPESLEAMIDAEAETGVEMRFRSKPKPEGHVGLWLGFDTEYVKTKPAWEAFRARHGLQGLVVEVCSCEVGDYFHVVALSGEVCEIN